MADILFAGADGSLTALVLDATPEERHRATAIATEHEVEQGVAISDHVRAERRTLTLKVVISDTPIRATTALGGAVRPIDIDLPGRRVRSKAARVEGGNTLPAELQEVAGGPLRLSVFQPDSPPTRVQDSWDLLMRAREEALLATISTKHETYESMALIEALVNRTAADGTWMQAELTFAEIRQVATELVDAPVPRNVRNMRDEEDGSVETTEAPTRRVSVYQRIREGENPFAGLFGGG